MNYNFIEYRENEIDKNIIHKWNRKCNEMDIKNIGDLLENMDIKTEQKWNEMIGKDIEDIIGNMLFDKYNYFNRSCGGDKYLYREVDRINYKNGKLKEIHIHRCNDSGKLMRKRFIIITFRKKIGVWKEKKNSSCRGFNIGWRKNYLNRCI